MNTQSSPSKIRRAVLRKSADLYVLITLLSFAGSVSFTRLFLQLTGYPQIGGKSELHIAHVLWGGLLLFIAALIPVLFANRWAFTLDAVLAGVGVGLFIDEVGKFITKTNDYFYPTAAPIIYAFFLLTVLLYLQVRRRRSRDPRAELYSLLSDFEEVLDRDLSGPERDDILRRLNMVEAQPDLDENLAALAQSLRRMVQSTGLELAPHLPGFFEKVRASALGLEKRWVTRARLRAGLVGAAFAMGAWSLLYPSLVLRGALLSNSIDSVMAEMVAHHLLRSENSLRWFELRLSLEISVGVILIAAAVLLLTRRDRRGVDLGSLGLLLSLTVANIFVFYFDQFSTILTSLLQFALLLGFIYYRRTFLHTTPIPGGVL